MVEKAIIQADLPQTLKDSLLSELPNFVEHIDEATNKIFNPSAIWLESIQFADYVGQLAKHLIEEGSADYQEEIAERLLIMSESFKELAEHAMIVIDQSQGEFKDGA